MDKEQAIDLLDNLIGMIEDNQGNDYDTAFRMAIEALKAQLSQEGTTSEQPVATDTNVGNNSEIPNSSDCISRQQAIDYCYQLINVEHQQGSDEMNYGQERVNQTETILHHLELMTSVQPEPQEGHWIKHESLDGGEQYECSLCGVLWEFNDGTPEDNEAYFCPKCGKKLITK